MGGATEMKFGTRVAYGVSTMPKRRTHTYWAHMQRENTILDDAKYTWPYTFT